MSIDPYERAYASSRRRTEEAQVQIDAARAEPTSVEIEAEMQDAAADRRARPLSDAGCTCSQQWKSLTWTQNGPTPHMVGCPDANGGGYSSANDANEVTAWSAINRTAPDSLTLSGAKLAAYRQLESASVAAHAAQEAMATTGQALRDAIQAMCAAIVPGAK